MCALDTLTQVFVSCPRDILPFLVNKRMLNQTKLYETEIGKFSLIIKYCITVMSKFRNIPQFL